MPFAVHERQAYAAIEEARLWCEEELRRSTRTGDERLVRFLHREIGLAGLHASEHLRPDRRRAMLALARRRAADYTRRACPTATLEPLSVLIDQALERVDAVLGVEGLCDEMEEANRRLLTARELLLAARARPGRLAARR